MLSDQPAPWSQDEELALIELWNDGFSAGACARRLASHFGRRYTRNMVIGKKRRLGLPDRQTLVFADSQTEPTLLEQRPRKSRGIPKKNVINFRTRPDREELLERMLDMRERGRSTGQIARALGLTRPCVYWQCAVHGVWPADRPPLALARAYTYRRGGRDVTMTTIDEENLMVELREQGVSLTEIARRVGRPYSTVKFRLSARAASDA